MESGKKTGDFKSRKEKNGRIERKSGSIY